jgi:hypothetical protein
LRQAKWRALVLQLHRFINDAKLRGLTESPNRRRSGQWSEGAREQAAQHAKISRSGPFGVFGCPLVNNALILPVLIKGQEGSLMAFIWGFVECLGSFFFWRVYDRDGEAGNFWYFWP